MPPAAISNWHYLAAALAASLLGFFASDWIDRLRTPVMAAALGLVTCDGGGVARDLLTLQVPTVLRSELYAVAALAGTGTVALGTWLGLPSLPVALAGAGLCLFLRLMSIYRWWHLPIAATKYGLLKKPTKFQRLNPRPALAGLVEGR